MSSFWVRYLDPDSGEYYYENSKTFECRWDAPEEYVEPEPVPRFSALSVPSQLADLAAPDADFSRANSLSRAASSGGKSSTANAATASSGSGPPPASKPTPSEANYWGELSQVSVADVLEFSRSGNVGGLRPSRGSAETRLSGRPALPRKQRAELPQLSAEHLAKYPLATWIEKNIAPIAKTLFGKAKTAKERMLWSDKELPEPLTIAPSTSPGASPSPPNSLPSPAPPAGQQQQPPATSAQHIFKDILSYMGLRKSKFGPGNLLYIQRILRHGIAQPSLRTEIWAQLLKQCDGSKSDDPRAKDPNTTQLLWEIIMCCAAVFGSTADFFPYLDVFLAKSGMAMSGATKPVQDNAKFARKLLSETMASIPRTFAVSSEEFTSLKAKEAMLVKVEMLDGSRKTVRVWPQTTAAEALEEGIAQKMKINLPSYEGHSMFAIYQQAWDKGGTFLSESPLDPAIRITDVLALQEEAHTAEPESTSTYKLVFKAKLFLSHMIDSLDHNTVHLLYTQAMGDMSKGVLNPSREHSPELASLLLQVKYDRIEPTSEDFEADVAQWLPRWCKHQKSKPAAKARIEMLNDIRGTWKMCRDLTSEQAKLRFLRTLHLLPMYGAAFFNVKHKFDVELQHWDMAAGAIKMSSKLENKGQELNKAPSASSDEDITLAINEKAVYWLDRKTRAVLRVDKLEWIISRGAPTELLVLVVDNPFFGGAQRVQAFETNQTDHMIELLRMYSTAPVSDLRTRTRTLTENRAVAVLQAGAADPELESFHSRNVRDLDKASSQRLLTVQPARPVVSKPLSPPSPSSSNDPNSVVTVSHNSISSPPPYAEDPAEEEEKAPAPVAPARSASPFAFDNVAPSSQAKGPAKSLPQPEPQTEIAKRVPPAVPVINKVVGAPGIPSKASSDKPKPSVPAASPQPAPEEPLPEEPPKSPPPPFEDEDSAPASPAPASPTPSSTPSASPKPMLAPKLSKKPPPTKAAPVRGAAASVAAMPATSPSPTQSPADDSDAPSSPRSPKQEPAPAKEASATREPKKLRTSKPAAASPVVDPPPNPDAAADPPAQEAEPPDKSKAAPRLASKSGAPKELEPKNHRTSPSPAAVAESPPPEPALPKRGKSGAKSKAGKATSPAAAEPAVARARDNDAESPVSPSDASSPTSVTAMAPSAPLRSLLDDSISLAAAPQNPPHSVRLDDGFDTDDEQPVGLVRFVEQPDASESAARFDPEGSSTFSAPPASGSVAPRSMGAARMSMGRGRGRGASPTGSVEPAVVKPGGMPAPSPSSPAPKASDPTSANSSPAAASAASPEPAKPPVLPSKPKKNPAQAAGNNV